nr:hypothetical protein L203_05141 [Cryptococcus depauperatus CBS 7841]
MARVIATVAFLTLGLLLITAYSSMVIDIIMIIKVRHYVNSYPPAVVALLVASILEALYTLCLVLRRRSVLAKASNVMSAIAFFTCFTFACIVATTVLRHHDDYCNSSVSNPGDLCGVLRGVEGLGWMLFGLNLIYLFIIPLLVSAGVGGRFFDTLGDLPREHQIENTMGEKAI